MTFGDSISTAIANALGLVKEWLGIESKKLDLKNTEAMKQAEAARQEQAVRDAAREAVAKGDLDKVRKIVSCLVLLCLLSGCARTIVPKPVESAQIAWDGTNQNAGIIMFTNGYLLITEQSRAKYNALTQKHGHRIVPPRLPDSGLAHIDGKWLMEPSAFEDWALMSFWEKQRPHQ